MCSADLSLIESAVNWDAGAWRVAAKQARLRRLQRLFYEMFTFVNQIDKYYFFVNKIMHNFKIGFKFVKHFLNSNLYFSRI